MDAGSDSWMVDLYDFQQELARPLGDVDRGEYGDVHAWARRNGTRQGTPFLLVPDATAD